MTATLRISGPEEQRSRRPGDTIELLMAWELDRPPTMIEARLFWFTAGKGTQDVTLVDTHSLRPTARGDERVRFRLPQAPYSFSGSLITLAWAVELVADGIAERWEFVLSPDSQEIRLDAKAPAPRGMSFTFHARR